MQSNCAHIKMGSTVMWCDGRWFYSWQQWECCPFLWKWQTTHPDDDDDESVSKKPSEQSPSIVNHNTPPIGGPKVSNRQSDEGSKFTLVQLCGSCASDVLIHADSEETMDLSGSSQIDRWYKHKSLDEASEDVIKQVKEVLQKNESKHECFIKVWLYSFT